MRIRPEQPDDTPQTRLVNEAAFAHEAEANLVDLLRERAHPLISLVAETRPSAPVATTP